VELQLTVACRCGGITADSGVQVWWKYSWQTVVIRRVTLHIVTS